MYHESRYIQDGKVYFKSDGPEIVLDDGVTISSSGGELYSYQIVTRMKSIPQAVSSYQIYLKPIIVAEMEYSIDKTSHLKMYPPSSEGWLRHVMKSGTKSFFSVQELKDESKRLLTIVEKDTLALLHIGLINPYEVPILLMESDWNVHNEIIYGTIEDSDVFDVLQDKSVTWSSLTRLIEGVELDEITIKETLEETLDQIVPKSFPHATRTQIMAFFAWLESAKIPDEDPIDFVIKYRSVGVFRALIRIHSRCLLDNVTPPKYAKIMQLAEKGQLELSQRPRAEAVEMDLWNLVRNKLYELSPSWRGRVVRYAIELQNSGRIVTELPVSREEAKKSRASWSDRFAMVNHTLYIRGFVNKKSIGLQPVIYSGSAHRWPHKHLEWTGRLGYDIDNPKYVQVMLMPSSSLERVTRIIPQVRLIDWETGTFNLRLYNEKKRKWKIKQNLILNSLEKSRSLRQLMNEFDKPRATSFYRVTKDGAKALDLISWGMYLSDLEIGHYAKYYGLSNSVIEQELNEMLNHGIFNLNYFLIPEKLKSLCIQAHGPPSTICSLSRAFLKFAPSCQVGITEKGQSCVVIARVPEDEHYTFAKNLTDAAKKIEISLDVLPITAYAGYRNNLYSRLRKEDGSWDDDVSGLLDQVRLKSIDDDD
ncbi:MAG: hypothetical protein ACFFF9_15870 [Candidatus Thorarchaeota archaeon]